MYRMSVSLTRPRVAEALLHAHLIFSLSTPPAVYTISKRYQATLLRQLHDVPILIQPYPCVHSVCTRGAGVGHNSAQFQNRIQTLFSPAFVPKTSRVCWPLRTAQQGHLGCTAVFRQTTGRQHDMRELPVRTHKRGCGDWRVLRGGDNMGVVLVLELCRSANLALLKQVRYSCIVQLGCNLRVSERWVPSERNPSREFDSDRLWRIMRLGTTS